MMADAKFLREDTLAPNSVCLNARKGSANQGNGCCMTGYIMNEMFSLLFNCLIEEAK